MPVGPMDRDYIGMRAGDRFMVVGPSGVLDSNGRAIPIGEPLYVLDGEANGLHSPGWLEAVTAAGELFLFSPGPVLEWRDLDEED